MSAAAKNRVVDDLIGKVLKQVEADAKELAAWVRSGPKSDGEYILKAVSGDVRFHAHFKEDKAVVRVWLNTGTGQVRKQRTIIRPEGLEKYDFSGNVADVLVDLAISIARQVLGLDKS